MKKVALFLLAQLLAMPALAAVTYTFTGPLFTITYGPAYTTSMRVLGSFTTDDPLPANMPNTGIGSLVKSYSFSDGVTTIASSDPHAVLGMIYVTTDADGNPTAASNISVHQWVGSPAEGNRYNNIRLYSTDGGGSSGLYNALCVLIGTGASTCTGYKAGAGESWGGTGTGRPGIWSRIVPHIGLWWNPDESGTGYNIDYKDGVIVLLVYSYLTNGDPIWYIASGTLEGDTFTGELNKARGGQCISCPYTGMPVLDGSAGTVTIKFHSNVTATMTLPGGRVTQIEPEAF